MGVVIKRQEYKNIPPGKYFAPVDKIEEGVGKYGAQLNWSFTVEHSDPEINGSLVTGITGVTATPKAKITRWFYAAGITITDEGIDTDALIGKRVVITIVENRQTKDGQESVYSNVVDVESITMYQNVAPQAQQPQTQPTPNPVTPQSQTPAQQPLRPQPQANQPTQAPSNVVNPSSLSPNEDIQF